MREDNGWGPLGMDSRRRGNSGGGGRGAGLGGVRLHMGLDSLRFLGPPLGKGADKDELDGGWKKTFRKIETR